MSSRASKRELKRHDKLRDIAESIQQKAEQMVEEVRKGSKGLKLLLRDAKSTLKALNVELAVAEDEREQPLVVPVTKTQAIDSAAE